MPNSANHHNGNILCAVDCETTGLDPLFHEMIQLCILPLDSNIEPRRDLLPFYINILPNNPERATREAMRKNRLRLAEIAANGFDSEAAKDMFEEWVKRLNLPYTKWGTRKRIIPVAQNYAFDMGFIKAWLGVDLYEEYFHACYCDTMIVAEFLNDHASAHCERVPFSKLNLRWLANKLNILYEKHHDALEDCKVTAAVYKKLVFQGLLA